MDAIDRQAAIDALEERIRVNGYSNVALVSELNKSIGYLMRLPSVQPERKKGKWLETDSHEPCWYKCDQCGRLHDFLDNYCPNCGSYNGGEIWTE